MTHRLLLDVSSLTYRAHFAMREGLSSPTGEPVQAVYGYLDMVTRLIATRHPDEIVHVYDHDWRPVERTRIYPGYKGARPDEPPEITSQFARIRQALDLTDMLQAETEGWEAEDAIGAFCVDATEDDRLEIISGDRDLIQLVRDPVVTLLFTVRGVTDLTVFNEAGVQGKYGVPADRYAEFAILRGDPSDNLPGVRGIGEKTARDLIVTFGSLDGVLEAAAAGDRRIKPATRARLLDSLEYLAAMRALVPVNADAKLSVWSGERDDQALMALGEELAVKGPVQRLLAAIGPSTGSPG